jgi:hypothetical protein
MSKLLTFIKSFGSALASSMESADSHAVKRISTPQMELIDNYLGSMVVKKGHSLFRIEASDESFEGGVYNSPTCTFVKVEKVKRGITTDTNTIIEDLKQGHIYVACLNEKNALKWYAKNYSSALWKS